MPEPLSFSAIRAKHAEMLKATTGAATPERLISVKDLIESVRMAGRTVHDEDDREYLRSLLTFWGNWVYNQTRTYPNTNLEVYVGEAPVKRMAAAPGGAGTTPMAVKPPVSPQVMPTAPKETAAVKAAPSVAASPAWLWPAIGLLGLVALLVIIGVVVLGSRVAAAPGSRTPTAAQLTFPVLGTPPLVTTDLPATGGGGFGSPFTSLAVQVTTPKPGEIVPVGQPVEIGGTFVNLQTGWRLFYVISDDAGNSIILPHSLTMEADGETGVWTATATFPKAGFYTVSVYIATSKAEKERLQRWADGGQVVTSDEQYDGVILFRDLAFLDVQ